MTYYVYHNDCDKWTEFNDWWDLIKFLKDSEDRIAHNKNDVIRWKTWTTKYTNGRYFSVQIEHLDYHTYIVYDEYERVINKRELLEGIKKFNPSYGNSQKRTSYYGWYNKRPIFKFRKDPVPYIRKGSGGGWFRHRHANKNYAAQLQEYVKTFPGDGRLRNEIFDARLWCDDIGLNKHSCDRSWKKSKLKKQWMKHM